MQYQAAWGAGAAITLIIASAGPVQAQVPGIWFGDSKTDPVTDKPRSSAFIYDQTGQASFGVRCRNGKTDLLLIDHSSQFTVGERQEVLLRIAGGQPLKLAAAAPEPEILAIGTGPDPSFLISLTKTDPIVLRYSAQYGREETLTFRAGLLPNSLSNVGRVLSDCGVAPYPEAEIEKTKQDLSEPPKAAVKRKK